VTGMNGPAAKCFSQQRLIPHGRRSAIGSWLSDIIIAKDKLRLDTRATCLCYTYPESRQFGYSGIGVLGAPVGYHTALWESCYWTLSGRPDLSHV